MKVIAVMALVGLPTGSRATEMNIDRTADCLSSLVFQSLDLFSWPESDETSASGSCADAQSAFTLCKHTPPRECLLARIPWQTSVSVVKCCFSCCQTHWQNELGLGAIYNHWFNNTQFKGVNFEYQFDSVPDLGSVTLSWNSAKRFSLFMWERSRSSFNKRTSILHNATHAVVPLNNGGGLIETHVPPRLPARACDSPFEPNVLEYALNHPVSTIYAWDTPCPRSIGTINRLGNFKGGGHYFTTNTKVQSGFVRMVPLGAKSSTFEKSVGDHGANRKRPVLLMCCCMSTDRGGRLDRVHDLAASDHGLCEDLTRGVNGPRLSEEDYAARLTQAKFVLSPSGKGKANFRDMEAVIAGAVPVIDEFIDETNALYGDDFPVIRMPVCYGTSSNVPPRSHSSNFPHYCNTSRLSAAFLEEEYAQLEARRPNLSVSQAFWPFWLYHMFIQVPQNHGSEELTDN